MPDLFVSPVTRGRLVAQPKSDAVVCEISGLKFPLVSGIPWLVPDAALSLSEWRNRAAALIAHYERVVDTLKLEAKAKGLPVKTQERLEATRLMTIKHLEFLREILQPLRPTAKITAELANAFGYRLPPNQALQGYFPNLLRDWATDGGEVSGENAASFAAFQKVVSEPLGRVLVLGAGACRLAYDLHETYRPEITVCADINPVLFLAAQRILNGEKISAVETPIAPKNLLSAAGRVRECRAPRAVSPGFHQVFADVYYLPFADETFDTVVTPWLIDILPQRFAALVSEINRVLKVKGQWLNSGSLNFQLKNWSDCISPEEAVDVCVLGGFEKEALEQADVPYLVSDVDSHRRFETLTSFRMRKTASRVSASVPMRAPWIASPDVPVGTYPGLESERIILESQAFLLSLIDGKRGVREIAAKLAERYGLTDEDAAAAVVAFLSRRHEANVFRY